MTATVRESVVVAAPAPAVFAAATDWRGQREWIFATTTTVRRGHGRSTGDEISARTGWGPLGFTDTMTITEWDPPRQCQVRHTGRVVRGTASFSVVDLGQDGVDGTSTSRFDWEEVLELPFGRLGAVGFALTRPLFTYFVRRSLRRFAVWATK